MMPARPHLVNGFAEKVIVYPPVVSVIATVGHLEIAKGNIADGHIKKAVRQVHLFKALHGDAAVLV